MAVAFDAASSTSVSSSALTSLTWLHTPAGTPTSVAVAVHRYHIAAPTISGITYGGNALTLATQSATFASSNVEIWGSDGVSLPSGAQNIVITFSGTGANCIAGAVTVTGSNTTTCFSASGSTTGSSTSPSFALSGTSVGELVVDIVGNENADSPMTQGGSQALRWGTIVIAGSGQAGAGSTLAGAAGSTTMSWTLGFVEGWGLSVASFKAAGGAAQTLVPGSKWWEGSFETEIVSY